MSDAAGHRWPAVSLEEARRILTAPGAPFETEEATIRGLRLRVYKNALPHLGAVLALGKQWGGRDFIVYEGERLTFEGHHRAVTALARVLADRYGVRKGERVVICMRNFPEWSIAFWSAAALGAIAVPFNAWGTGDDLAHVLRDSGARVAILDEERLTRLAPHLDSFDTVGFIAVRTAPEACGRAAPLAGLIGPPAGYASLAEQDLPDPALSPDDDATILYTSGTTGRPKGALGTHRNIMTNLINIGYGAARAAIRRGEALPRPDPDAPQRAALLPVPFFHVTGCHSIMVPTMVGGGKLVLMHRWNAERALALIEQERINALTGVPTMIWQVLQSPEFGKHDLSSIDSVTYGGAAAPPELTHKVRELFPKVYPATGYGATETSSVSTSNAAEDYLERPDSVGLPTPVVDVRVVDPSGQDVPRGETGELWIRGPHVVRGYWNNPAATAERFVEGWFRTGDIVRMDADGFIYLLDRISDMLIRGGENVYCVEIEDAFYTHPAVLDVAVVGVPHKVLGEEVGAIVQLRPGAEVTEAELRAHVAQRLAAYKQPTYIWFKPEGLPRNAAGKTLKSQLRKEVASLVAG